MSERTVLPWRPWVNGRAAKAKVGRYTVEAYPAMGGGFGYVVIEKDRGNIAPRDDRPIHTLAQAKEYAEEAFLRVAMAPIRAQLGRVS